ncbi:NUMOD4 motif-containing HNH endonuclease [Chryseobacterium sp. Ch-15]|uniref:HNH endonuclease n=1 Tax=Chryseobacterium muglaense TaxID=2893752 RepID=A0A9Q3USH1_9FLAO|nr:NUMOD4 motif-containing HNH endonuclease [Chryseobacterium muglaense]MBD3904465.1 HNH endonuclease [Chryseobacterium muglaense]MCC9032716.1 NUMOD4 motif-containing HNH endonuclease [Chryseobacterium muglaense]MCM2554227.1 NUMOD4 motif-containing HNH endonuclease [Chryseobacterium muglaense]
MNHLQHSKEVINTIKERADRVNPFLGNEEIWIPAIDLEEIFEVSNWGNVRSIDREITRTNGIPLKIKGKIINTSTTAKGYKIVGIRIYGTSKKNTFKVHNLIYESFSGKLEVGYEVDHKDRNKSNNALSNLRSVNRRANCLNKSNNKMFPGVTTIGARYSAKIHYKGNNFQLGVYDTVEEASKIYKKAVRSIDDQNFDDFLVKLNYKTKKIDLPKYISFRSRGLGSYPVFVKGVYVGEFKTLQDAESALEKYLKLLP